MKTNIISIIFTAVSVLFCMPAFSQINEVGYEQNVKHKDLRIAVGGGYAMRSGSVLKTGNKTVDDMSSKLRHGFAIDADGQYFFKETWGIGFNANTYSSSTSGGGFTMEGFEGNINNYEETQRIVYVGPSFATRLETDKFLLTASVGVGPLFFMDNITVNGIEGKGNQTTFGANVTLGGEYKLKNKMGLGLKLSQITGTIDSMNFEGQKVKSEETMNVSSFTASLFLSFRSW